MSRPLVIGTAGHIDHGKTALVQALTGVDTDRLAEEKQRGITIDLGFTQLPLPDGSTAGLVDVPGHEDFIRNMVAGASGIDVALLVVAADEGMMPQTREHLDILQVLGVERAVVALTKVDLVDEEWLALARDDLRNGLAGTTLEDAPVVAVSARSRVGLEELLGALAGAAAGLPERDAGGAFRMPVDRTFTIHGTGTVVTGTVRDGALRVGDEAVLLPAGVSARVRAIQSHGLAADSARPGMRTALALSGVERGSAGRGSWVASAGWPLSPMLTVSLRLLRDTTWRIRQRQRVRVHIGTAEVMARIVLLDRESLEQGDDDAAWAQLRLEAPVLARYGDRFVVRSYSPVTTIGGGSVLEPVARKRRRLTVEDRHLLAALEALLGAPGSAPDGAFAALVQAAGPGGLPTEEVPLRLGARHAAAVLRRADHDAFAIVSDRIHPRDRIEEGVNVLVAAVVDWHRRYPLRPGMDHSEGRRRLEPTPPDVADAVIAAALAGERLVARDGSLAAPGFLPTPDAGQAEARARLERLFLEAGLAPPRPGELPADLRDRPDLRDLLGLLEADGVLLRYPPDRLLHARVLAESRQRLEERLGGRSGLTPAEFRDLFDLPRKHLIPLLEHFDRLGWTRREGEGRSVPARLGPLEPG